MLSAATMGTFIKVILTITIIVSKSGNIDRTSGHDNGNVRVLNTYDFNAEYYGVSCLITLQ
jgi:hypothetical protein